MPKQTVIVPASSTNVTLVIELPDSVVVTQSGGTPIQPPTTNQPPIVNAGGDQVIALPVNSVQLNGAASDSDGNVVGVAWEQTAGATATIVSPNSTSTQIMNLTQGSYSFQLSAVDNQGARTSDSVNVTVNAASTGYTPAYSNGYNTSADINANQLGRGSISTTQFKTGPGSFRSEVRAGDQPISSGWRSEQQYDQANENPLEGAVEYDVYYENWKDVSNDGGGHSIQWHPNTGGGSAIISLQNYAMKFDVVRSLGGTNWHQPGTLQTVIPNKWYHMRWEFKWSTGTDGYVRLLIDGNLYFSFNGKTADGSGQYLKVGQNRWPWSGNTMGTTTVCYYDNLQIFKKS